MSAARRGTRPSRRSSRTTVSCASSTRTPPKHIQAAIISRLKIMADMDIAERRLPQDGRIQLKADNRDIDLRVSTIPTVFGEKVVMRILDKSHTVVGIEKIGLLSDNRE